MDTRAIETAPLDRKHFEYGKVRLGGVSWTGRAKDWGALPGTQEVFYFCSLPKEGVGWVRTLSRHLGPGFVL